MNKERNTDKTIVYSALTFVLLVFLIQSGFGLIVNVLKNINVHAQLQIVKHAHNKALKENNKLKFEIESCKSEKSLEAIARNNLKMAADDEILLTIMSDNDDIHTNLKEKPKKEKGIFYKR